MVLPICFRPARDWKSLCRINWSASWPCFITQCKRSPWFPDRESETEIGGTCFRRQSSLWHCYSVAVHLCASWKSSISMACKARKVRAQYARSLPGRHGSSVTALIVFLLACASAPSQPGKQTTARAPSHCSVKHACAQPGKQTTARARPQTGKQIVKESVRQYIVFSTKSEVGAANRRFP